MEDARMDETEFTDILSEFFDMLSEHNILVRGINMVVQVDDGIYKASVIASRHEEQDGLEMLIYDIEIERELIS